MKHTGKPPKKSTNRTPARAAKRPGKSPRDKRGSGEKRSDRAPDSRTGKQPEKRNDTRPAHPADKAFAGRAERGPERSPNRDFDRPRDQKKPFRNSRPARPVREPREKREPRSSLGPRANMFGLHAVREAWLNPKRYIHALYLSEAAEAVFGPVLELAHHRGLERPEPKILGKDDFDRLLGRDVVHQGVALSAAPLEEAFIQDIISIGANKPRSVILMLDQVTDPHNVGAILRSACAFGADGVVMQRRHAPELDGVLAKTASGAADHIPVAYETNLSRTLEELAEAGYVAIGLDEHADKTLSEITVPEKSVLVLGAEGDGMRRLIREHCDVLVTLPTKAPIASLNVSNAAAVALFALISG